MYENIFENSLMKSTWTTFYILQLAVNLNTNMTGKENRKSILLELLKKYNRFLKMTSYKISYLFLYKIRYFCDIIKV